jgi:signal transduction histidine kinase
MDSADAFRLLQSTRLAERILGSRFLEHNARAEEIQSIRELIAAETVPWVRASLERALRTISGEASPARVTEEPRSDHDRDVLARAQSDVTRLLLHEISPIFGAIKYFASQEVPEYESSKVRIHVQRLDALLESIATLGRAAQSPSRREFDLTSMVAVVREGEESRREVDFQLAGPDSLLVIADPALIEIVLRNGVSNAVESYPATATSRPVTLSWGDTERDYWITVLDRGIGLPAEVSSVWEPGRTTKPGHVGLGLSILRRAISSMGGTVTLQARDSGGTRLEVRWPKATGHTDEATLR